MAEGLTDDLRWSVGLRGFCRWLLVFRKAFHREGAYEEKRVFRSWYLELVALVCPGMRRDS